MSQAQIHHWLFRVPTIPSAEQSLSGKEHWLDRCGPENLLRTFCSGMGNENGQGATCSSRSSCCCGKLRGATRSRPPPLQYSFFFLTCQAGRRLSNRAAGPPLCPFGPPELGLKWLRPSRSGRGSRALFIPTPSPAVPRRSRSASRAPVPLCA